MASAACMKQAQQPSPNPDAATDRPASTGGSGGLGRDGRERRRLCRGGGRADGHSWRHRSERAERRRGRRWGKWRRRCGRHGDRRRCGHRVDGRCGRRLGPRWRGRRDRCRGARWRRRCGRTGGRCQRDYRNRRANRARRPDDAGTEGRGAVARQLRRHGGRQSHRPQPGGRSQSHRPGRQLVDGRLFEEGRDVRDHRRVAARSGDVEHAVRRRHRPLQSRQR